MWFITSQTGRIFSRLFQAEEPNTVIISNGFAAMGIGLPGAMAAKLLHPDRRVAAVVGDGGFLMNVQDLETAVRLGLNIVVMVWDDGEYGLIKWKQQNHFKGRHSELGFRNPDFEMLARSFGAWGRRVGTPGELKPVLAEALRRATPEERVAFTLLAPGMNPRYDRDVLGGWLLGVMVGGGAAWALLQWPRFRRKLVPVAVPIEDAQVRL